MSTVYTVYTQGLNGNGAILKQRIESFAKVEDMLSCREEVFLQQSVLQDSVESYAEALEAGDKAKKAAWGELVNTRAREVISSKEKMAKIEQWKSQNITRETLFMIVRNIADLLYDTFGTEDKLMGEKEYRTEKIADVVAAIESGVLGTSTKEVSEVELFAEMVNSVPLLEVS